MHIIKDFIITGSNDKPITTDIFFSTYAGKRPVVIFAHGFNGFKDWGNFDLIAKRFAESGFTFLKFNFSHNGTVPGHPEEFLDLNAFGNNNYSKQLFDLQKVTDHLFDTRNSYHSLLDLNNIFLIGHSMGGGIAIIYAATDHRIKKLITWAAISECKTPWGSFNAEQMKEWEDTGVQYYYNGRTKQQMPLYYQLYEDYQEHREKLNIEAAVKSLQIPVLICHGTIDMAVPVEKAYDLMKWQPAAELFTVESDHVFGRMHPWPEDKLPAATDAVLNESIRFLRSGQL